MSVTPDLGSPAKSQEERALEARAVQALGEYRLVKDGVTTYAALGYGLPGGGVTQVKALEYLAIESDMADAIEDKRKRANG